MAIGAPQGKSLVVFLGWGKDKTKAYDAARLNQVIGAAEQHAGTDKDGKISKKELESYVQSLPANSRDREIARDLLGHFDEIEDNKDGKKDGTLSDTDVVIEAATGGVNNPDEADEIAKTYKDGGIEAVTKRYGSDTWRVNIDATG